MLCVRCGKVLNVEDRRCPQCLASLTNERIRDGEVLGYQVREIVQLTAGDMKSPRTRRGAVAGILVGALGMILSLSPALIAAGAACGGLVGWLASWRRWGQIRATLLFALLMAAPVLAFAHLWPLALLNACIVGMVVGIAQELSRD